MIREYHGIVLKNIKYSERDKILTVFTKEKGKISVMAKNAMSKKSKVLVQTDLFSYSMFYLYPGKNFYTLQSADYIKSFTGLQTDLERMSFASYICELIDIFYEDKMEEETAFNLILYSLSLLEKVDEERLSFVVLAFMLKLIGINGILPDFRSCNICKSSEKEYYLFDFEEGSILCKDCSLSSFSKSRIKTNELELLQLLAYISLKDMGTYDFSKWTQTECNNMIVQLNNYITYVTHMKTNSFKFLSDMLILE